MCGRNFLLGVLVRFGTLQAAICQFELSPSGSFGWLACSFLRTFQFHNPLLASGFILIHPRISFPLPSIFSWFALALQAFWFWKVNTAILLCHILRASPFFSSGTFGILLCSILEAKVTSVTTCKVSCQGRKVARVQTRHFRWRHWSVFQPMLEHPSNSFGFCRIHLVYFSIAIPSAAECGLSSRATLCEVCSMIRPNHFHKSKVRSSRIASVKLSLQSNFGSSSNKNSNFRFKSGSISRASFSVAAVFICSLCQLYAYP